MKATDLKWRTVLVLALIYAAALTGMNRLWGILYLIWVLPAFRDGVVHFVEDISRDKEPALFWVLTLTLSALSLLTLFEPLTGSIMGGAQ